MRLLTLLTVIFVAALPASAAEVRVGDLVIADPVIREGPPTAPALAGYLIIRNAGAFNDRLISISAPFAGMAALHNMAMKDGVMEMSSASDGFVVAPGESLTLAPGGKHIMFMMIKTRPAAPQEIVLELTFERAGKVDIPFTVVKQIK